MRFAEGFARRHLEISHAAHSHFAFGETDDAFSEFGAACCTRAGLHGLCRMYRHRLDTSGKPGAAGAQNPALAF